MSDETKPATPAPAIVPQTGEATKAAATTGSPAAGATASAPPTSANPAATPAHAAPVAHAAPKPVAPRPPAAPIPDLAGKTTSGASIGGQAAKTAAPAAAVAATRDPDDASPLLSRRAWLGLAWGAFAAASAAALAATGRFMFPNVLNEPPQQFKAGFPADYGMGVDERWKEKFAIWLVKVAEEDIAPFQGPRGAGFYALITVCTHLGCTPNYLSAENKFKCPCHGSGYRLTGINFEGPAPRPLERARIVLADDGQILVDKSKHYQAELGQWADPEAYLKA